MRRLGHWVFTRSQGLGFAVLAVAIALEGGTPGQALASDGEVYLELSAGPLQEAIDRLASSAQLQVLYDPAVVSGRTTQGVKGAMTPAQALDRLLTSTDIAYRFTANDAVALYRKHRVSSDPPRRLALAAPVPSSPPLQTVRVSAVRSTDRDSGGSASLTAMKFDGSSLTAPIASESITQQALRDQQAERVEDVLEGISAIESAPDGQSTLGFTIRGFPTYQYYVDGVRVSPDLHHDAFRDLANVERIDVVKGPASTLYGRTEPGGLINVVTKQPLAEPHLAVEQQAGAFDRQRTQLDAGGPLTSSGSLLYRFNAAYETANSFRDYLSNRRLFLAPVATWKISPQSETTGYLEYLHSDDPTDSGLPLIGSTIPPVPIARRLEDGGAVHTRDLRVGVRGLHAFSDRWSMRYHVDGRWLKTPQSPQLALADDMLDPSLCSPASCPVNQLLFAIPVSRGQTYYSSAELLGSLTSWGAQHHVLFGAEYFDVRARNEVVFSYTPFMTDLFSPQHGPVPSSLLENPDWANATATTERWSSAYVQDQIAFAQKFYLLLGARYDVVSERLDSGFGLPILDAGTERRWDHAFKRRAGLVWRATEPLSLYANYTENFGISTGIYGEGTGGTGTLVPAESAHEWEIGAKSEFLEGKASGSLAWFDLTEVNISLPVFSPVLDAQGFRAVTGGAHSRGLELDVQVELMRGLQLAASYAFLDSRITDDAGITTSTSIGGTMNNLFVSTVASVGHRLYGAPRHGGSLWIEYKPDRLLRGLKLGVGAVARGSREGDNANDYQLPGFVKYNLLAAYGWRMADTRVTVQLNMDNALNTRYFESIGGTHTVMPGSPRRWLASVRAEL